MPENANIFARMTVVFTGKLAAMPRHEAEKLVAENGGQASATLSLNTDYLIVGDGGFLNQIDKSQKLKKAEAIRENGGKIQIISETTFLELLNLESRYLLENKYYPLSEILKIYQKLRADQVRYFQKWGLLQPAKKTYSEQYFEFKDLLSFRQIHTYLQAGKSLRGIARSLAQDYHPTNQLKIEFEEEKPAGHVLELKIVKPEPTVEDWYDLGNRYDLNPATFEPAIEAYQKALKLDPNYVPALVNLGNIFFTKGQLDQAEAMYLHAQQLLPHNPKILFNLGNLADERNDFPRACDFFQQAIVAEPFYADAHFNLAVTYEKMGRITEAKIHWERYLKVDTNGEWTEIAKEHLSES